MVPISLKYIEQTAETSEASSPSAVAAALPHIQVTPWMTTAEAAAYLKIKPRTLLIWVRQRKVRADVLSGTERRVWRFLQTDLDRMLAHSQELQRSVSHAAP